MFNKIFLLMFSTLENFYGVKSILIQKVTKYDFGERDKFGGE
jgi:hypothetical protein